MSDKDKVDDYLDSIHDTILGIVWGEPTYYDVRQLTEAAYLAGYTFKCGADEEA